VKITGKVEGGNALIQSTNLLSSQMIERLRKVVAKLAVELVAKVKSEKLSDQVLHVRTGRLRRSITFRLNNSMPNTATATVGTNVSYARIHEYGFKGPVNVRTYMRKAANGGEVVVKAHVRNVNMPERSFLRSALGEMKGEIMQRMNDAIVGRVTA